MGVSKMLQHLDFTQSLVSMFLIVVCNIVLMMWSVHEKKIMYGKGTDGGPKAVYRWNAKYLVGLTPAEPNKAS